MKIEHIAIWAKDIETLRLFYEKYFNAESSPKYTNTAKKFSSYFLTFSSGARLEIMEMDGVKEGGNTAGEAYFGLTHFAISVGSEELVNQFSERFKKDGFKVLDGPRRTGDGYYEVTVLDPEGNRLEITV